MKNFQHLTKNQILAYAADSLNEVDSKEIGRHLLNCEICRKSLPIPTVEQFWSVIMTDTEGDDKSADKSTVGFSSVNAGFSSFWKSYSNLIWSGATLIVLISFSVLIWLSIGNSNREVAGVINNEGTSEGKPLLSTSTPAVKVPTPPDSNRVVIAPRLKQPKIDSAQQMPSRNNVFQKSERKELNKKDQISEIRGVSTNCNEEKGIELEFSINKENFVFRWKKVQNAVKYHLYISDDDEILIDEYETEAETTFVLKKPLDPLKSYKWKIIVTLENGKAIIGASQKFNIKSFQTYQVKSVKRKNSDVRCQANK